MKTRILLTTALVGAALVAPAQTGIPGPHLLVYKTKKDYSKLVPVILSDDKSKIVSYPDPVDIKKKGKGQEPVSLHRGYLMDNTGIGINTAFLKMTYTEFAKLKSAPPLNAMNKMIRERNPLTILYDCGLKSKYKNPTAEANRMIDKKLLAKDCTQITK